MPKHPAWIVVLVAGIALAVLGIDSMSGSTFMGWLMIAFALAFFFISYKTYKMNK